MYCPSCGKPIQVGSAFCQHCGTQIGAAKKSKDGWELLKEFWSQLGIVGAILAFIGAQFGASSLTALVDGVLNPSMQEEAGSTVLGIFLKTGPLTLALAWLTVRTLNNADVHFYEIIGVLTLGVGLSYLITAGMSLETVSAVLANQRMSGLPGVLLAFIEAFIRAFGWAALVQSVILGIFFGYWIKKVQPAKAA